MSSNRGTDKTEGPEESTVNSGNGDWASFHSVGSVRALLSIRMGFPHAEAGWGKIISDEGYIMGKCPEVVNCRGSTLAGTWAECGERLHGRNISY